MKNLSRQSKRQFEILPSAIILRPNRLIRSVYRSLINSGRTYAAFSEDELRLLDSLPTDKVVLDPMSGYGLVTLAAAQLGRSSYTLELNLPQYLWQVLTNPATIDIFCTWIEAIQHDKRNWPQAKMRIAVSKDWFSEEGFRLLYELYQYVEAKAPSNSKKLTRVYALALLLPFSGRFSSSLEDNNPTHVKPGGMCVFREWDTDFDAYLTALQFRLQLISDSTISESHHFIGYGDARVEKFDAMKFGAMLTSPPYPNRSDYYDMFAPENDFVRRIHQLIKLPFKIVDSPLLGTVRVKGTIEQEITSRVANEFLESIKLDTRQRIAANADERYYFPYFRNYFIGLELAYKNIAKSFNRRFLGYITIVNNTHRGVVIPMEKIICDIWIGLGFSATLVGEHERFHFGTMNPRARGIRARHKHYIIKLER